MKLFGLWDYWISLGREVVVKLMVTVFFVDVIGSRKPVWRRE